MWEEKHTNRVACCYWAGKGNTGLTEVLLQEATKQPFLKGTNRTAEKLSKSYCCVCQAPTHLDWRQTEQGLQSKDFMSVIQ